MERGGALEDEALGILQDFDRLRSFRFIQRGCDTPRHLDDAYALQRRFKALRVERGEETIGFKVGCTGPTVRATLGIKESVHGYLWRHEQMKSGAVLSESRFRRLGIEGELCVRLISTQGPVAEWLVDYEPIIELHHFVFDGPPETRAYELIARNALHCGVVHASGRRRCRLGDIPLDRPIVVTIDGHVVEAPVLRDLELVGLRGPVATITWLIERLRAEQNGEQLKPGNFILTATPGNVIPLEAGSRLDVDFMGLRASCAVVAADSAEMNARL